jgi:hypothetical protein
MVTKGVVPAQLMGVSVRVAIQPSALIAPKGTTSIKINAVIAKILSSTVSPVKKGTVVSVKQEGVL